MQVQRVSEFSLAPGFSPVWDAGVGFSRFNDFSSQTTKPLKRLTISSAIDTGLKPGANERIDPERLRSLLTTPFYSQPWR